MSALTIYLSANPNAIERLKADDKYAETLRGMQVQLIHNEAKP